MWRLWSQGSGPPGPIRRQAGLNVLLITIDTLRVDAVGAYGNPKQPTPWIDRLAESGVRFETAHAHNVVTLPSHANILTGRYPFDHGVRDNTGFRLPQDMATLATLLKAEGYRTGAFVSAFPLDSRFGLARGFDVYDDHFADGQDAETFHLPERTAAATVDAARQWLAREPPGVRPTFCWVHVYDPHAPYTPAAPHARRFADNPYLGEVAATDAALEPLLAPLLAKGVDGHTLVVLTADHGESLGEHGEERHGLFAYEATLRVPLILSAPVLWNPRVVAVPARHIDLLPTVLDALELPVGELPGTSLVPAAAGHAASGEAPSYFEALSGVLGRGWAPLRGVLRGRSKYVDLPIPELYDLNDDPGETHNLAASRPRLREGLLLSLKDFRDQDLGVRRTEESGAARRRLATLGYVTTAAPPKKRYTRDDDPKRLIHLDKLMQQAIAHHRTGNLDAALALCHQVVAQRPDMTAAWLQLALIQRRRAQLDEAEAALSKVLDLNPNDTEAVSLLAAILADTGRDRAALDLLSPHAAPPRASFDVLMLQGTLLARSGQTKAALASLAAAQSLDPRDPMVYVQRATVHMARAEWTEAAQALGVAEDLNPRLAPVQHGLGLLAVQRGDDAGAEQRFRRTLEFEPRQADALLRLGTLLLQQKREDEARNYLEDFVRTAPPAIYGRQVRAARTLLSRPSRSGGRGK